MCYKLYSLNHPITNEIRYIGQTKNTLKKRLTEHLRDKKSRHKMFWINSLKRENLTPKIVLIQEFLTAKDCSQAEIEYIATLPNLTNIMQGGSTGLAGLKHTTATKRKISKALSGRILSKKTKEKLRLLAIKQFSGEQVRTEMSLLQRNRKEVGKFSLDGVLLETFISLREIERKHPEYHRQNIYPVCEGKFKQGYGFIWRYL